MSSRMTAHAPQQHATQFGYEPVAETEKAARVGEVFHKVAKRYDLMNDLMSGGLHRAWKNHFVGLVAPTPGKQYLDMAGGTGDIAFRMQDSIRNIAARRMAVGHKAHIIIADINPSMLAVGQDRALNDLRLINAPCCTLEFACADAETLPFPGDHFDAYTIAFGIRNVTHMDRALKEAFRVLKPGGLFACLEFSPEVHTSVRALYDRYSFTLLPAMGRAVAGDADSYRYLAESIRLFPAPARFAAMMEEAGFERVRWETLTFGTVAIHRGWKL